MLTRLDWLVIGGGIHGTHISHVLTNGLGVDPDGVRVLDDAPTPLAAWHTRTQACGMRYLRSPQAHHLDLRTDSLRRFAPRERPDAFIAPYRRPALALFNDHAQDVLTRGQLARLRITGRARRIEPAPGGYAVTTQTRTHIETLHARHIMLAPGPGTPSRPDWADGIVHVFDPGFRRDNQTGAHVAVVGGGATGGQLALALADAGTSVTLVTPRPLEQTDFDSDPCYLGPRCMIPFARRTMPARRKEIGAARQPGTLPRDVYRGVTRHPGIRVVNATVIGQTDSGLYLSDGRALAVDRVVLATGLGAERPGGALVSDAIAGMDLPVDDDGWPLPAPDLQWRPGLHVCGGLAELELGPAAPNIAGARMAGRRLAGLQRAGNRRYTGSEDNHVIGECNG